MVLILFQNSSKVYLINRDVKLDYTIVDRFAIVTHAKDLSGTREEPLYVKRRDRI